jgi:hypothetical protein
VNRRPGERGFRLLTLLPLVGLVLAIVATRRIVSGLTQGATKG